MEKCYEQYIHTLREFSYPGVSHLKKDDYPKEFEGEKRLFLLNWLLKQLNIDIPYPEDGQSKHMNSFSKDVATTIESCGFCDGTVKTDFVNGNLDAKNQKLIFDRVFHMLCTVKNMHDNKPKSLEEADIAFAEQLLRNPTEGLKDHLNDARNLFPSQGPTVEYSNEKREQLIESAKEEIKILTNELYELKLSMSDQVVTDFSQINSENVVERATYIPKNLKKHCEKFLIAASPIVKYHGVDNSEKSIADELKANINTTHTLLGDLAQFTESSNKGEKHLESINVAVSQIKEIKPSEIVAELKDCSKIMYDLELVNF